MILLIIKKYKGLYADVIKNKVIDPASYMEFYTYCIINENYTLKKNKLVQCNFQIKDGLPLSHARPGPDIEIYLNTVAFICECSIRSGKKQFDDEHESVSRHYEVFKQEKHSKYKYLFGLFVSQKIHIKMKMWFFELFNEISVIPIDLEDFIVLMSKLVNVELDEYEKVMLGLLNLRNVSKNQKEWADNIYNYINNLDN